MKIVLYPAGRREEKKFTAIIILLYLSFQNEKKVYSFIILLKKQHVLSVIKQFFIYKINICSYHFVSLWTQYNVYNVPVERERERETVVATAAAAAATTAKLHSRIIRLFA